MWTKQDTNARRSGALSASTSQTTRLIIVDHRALIRECITSCLRMLTRKIEILRGAANVEDLRVHELAEADIIMLSTSVLPAFNDAVQHEIARLLFNRPDVPIVLIADLHDAEEAQYIVSHCRLRGYLPTSSTLAAVEAALDVILAGGTYLPPKSTEDSGGTIGVSMTANRAGAAKLTERERLVLLLLREGMPNKIIAHRLGISLSTVKAHVHSIMTKLHSRNRTEAAMFAGEPIIAGLPSRETVNASQGQAIDHPHLSGKEIENTVRGTCDASKNVEGQKSIAIINAIPASEPGFESYRPS